LNELSHKPALVAAQVTGLRSQLDQLPLVHLCEATENLFGFYQRLNENPSLLLLGREDEKGAEP
jgi:hypothetical protein